MAMAVETMHRPNGFFITNEGWEYVALISAAAVALGALGPGRRSLDGLLGLDDKGSAVSAPGSLPAWESAAQPFSL